MSKMTEQGRVTDEHMTDLERWATRHGQNSRPWTVGVRSHVLKALIDELRLLRDQDTRERKATE